MIEDPIPAPPADSQLQNLEVQVQKTLDEWKVQGLRVCLSSWNLRYRRRSLHAYIEGQRCSSRIFEEKEKTCNRNLVLRKQGA